MATNFFFNNFKSSQEQLLLEDLVIEAIKIYGHDIYYIPRVLNNYDPVYGADDVSTYEQALPLEMYIKSIDGFSGDQDFMSKFGIEIRDQVVFSVARRIFSEEVSNITTQVRPNEGDLIFFPLNNKCFEIKHVNKFEMFYQLGALQTWEMTCELFEYAGERFTTGIAEIDSVFVNNSVNQYDWAIRDQLGRMLTDEDGNVIVLQGADAGMDHADNDMIQQESDLFVDWGEVDPFSERQI